MTSAPESKKDQRSPSISWKLDLRAFIVRYGLPAGVVFATLRLITRYFGWMGPKQWDGIWLEVIAFAFAALFFGILWGWIYWATMNWIFRSRSRDDHT